MGRGALATAWVLSVLPWVLPLIARGSWGADAGAEGLDGAAWTWPAASHLGWALVPWIALAGLPLVASRPGATLDERCVVRPEIACALALAPLALGAALDRDAGFDAGALALRGGLGLVLIYALARAAWGGTRRAVAYGVAWWLLVPGTVLCAWALGQGGVAVPGLDLLAQQSPLAWALARAGSVESGTWTAALGPLATAAICLAASTGAPRGTLPGARG